MGAGAEGGWDVVSSSSLGVLCWSFCTGDIRLVALWLGYD